MPKVASRADSAHGRWINALSMTTVALLAFLLYRRALGFAFFNDDPTGHFAWMATRTIPDFFTSSADYGYYRPIVFTVLQSLVTVAGYNPLPFHALLLALHAANVALLWLLASRLGLSRPYAWAAALIFATAPFSYEAVGYVASLTHPLMLFWLLLTLLLYQNMRTATAVTRRMLYGIAAYLTLILGLLTHENALFVVPALVGIEWLAQPPQSLRTGLQRPFLPYFVAPILYLLLWLTIPKSSEQGLASLSDWASNMLPFLQTLVYPLLPAVSLDAAQTTALAFLALLTLAGLLGAAWIGRRVPLWAFGLGWFFFSALPATLFLQPDYLYGSPRLQYLPSAGVALLWALPLPALFGAERQTFAKAVAKAVGLLYTLAIALPPVAFVQCELDFYAEGSRIVRQMAVAAAQTAADDELTYVNVPFFFSSSEEHPAGCPNSYPWSPVGTVVIPPYAAARDFVRFNGGPDRPLTAVTAPDFSPGWNTFGSPLAPPALREKVQAGSMWVFDLNSGGFFDLGSFWVPAQPQQPFVATFGPGLALLASGVDTSTTDGILNVDLVWQVERPWAAAPAVFVHLYNAAGMLVAQRDGPPGDGRVPVSLWATSDILREVRPVTLSRDLPAGVYTLVTGLYDPITGERYMVQQPDGSPPQDALTIDHITLP